MEEKGRVNFLSVMTTKSLTAAGAAVSLLIASGPALAFVLWSRVSAGARLARRGVGSRWRDGGVATLIG